MGELCSKARDAPKSYKELGLDVSLIKFGSEPDIYFQIKIPAMVSEYKTTRPSGIDAKAPYQDAIMRGATGVKYQEPTLSVQANTALKKVSTGLKALGNAVGSTLDTVLKSNPIIGALDALATPETITQKHDKKYKSDIDLLSSQIERCKTILKDLSIDPNKQDSFIENISFKNLIKEMGRT